MSPRVEWLEVAGDPEVWRSLGFVVTHDGLLPLHGTSLKIVPPPPAGDDSNPAAGITAWALSDLPASAVHDVDGLPTAVVEPAAPTFADHPNGAVGLDHVVITTPDLERTSAEIALKTGCELKRVREVGTMRQGFHRIGPGGLIVELVERPEVPDGPASFWGVVVNVDDLDAACALIGTDRVSSPKDAVQPGRRIATLRQEIGLGLPVAFMTT